MEVNVQVELMTSDVPQGSVLGPVLFFNVFLNDTGSEVKLSLSKFADETKLSGTVDTPEYWGVIQENPDNLEKCAHENLMRLNRAECKVMHVGQGNPRHEHRWRSN